jgi:hypothetical protein
MFAASGVLLAMAALGGLPVLAAGLGLETPLHRGPARSRAG